MATMGTILDGAVIACLFPFLLLLHTSTANLCVGLKLKLFENKHIITQQYSLALCEWNGMRITMLWIPCDVER